MNKNFLKLAIASIQGIAVSDYNPDHNKRVQTLGSSLTKPTFHKAKQRAKVKAARKANKLRRMK